MTEDTDPAPADTTAAKPRSSRNTARWITAAGMGIGSAALVAALLYANHGRKAAAPARKVPPGENDPA